MRNIIKNNKIKNIIMNMRKFIDGFSSNYPILLFYIVSNFINSVLLLIKAASVDIGTPDALNKAQRLIPFCF